MGRPREKGRERDRVRERGKNPPTSRGGKGSPQAVNSGHLRTENSRLQAEVEELKKQVASAGVLKAADRKCYLTAGYF